MSRIHEALKKAERERTSIPVVDPIPSLPLSRAGESAEVPGAFSQPAPTIADSAAIDHFTRDYLRFDDLRARCSHPQWRPDPNVNVFSNAELSPRATEQFRTLRSRLYQLQQSQSVRTLLVTSSIPGEGKTFVAMNLAQAIVRQPDRRVLLIDADLRRSRLHVPLGAPCTPGLADYLRGEADELAVIQQEQGGNLCFIPGGNESSNPSELLSNDRLKKLLVRLGPVFDWVIIDSPPCLPVADASVLADLCDGVLLVVRAGSTPSSTAQRACQELQGRKIAGVVLNAMTETPAYGPYHYYGYGRAHNDSNGAEKRAGE